MVREDLPGAMAASMKAVGIVASKVVSDTILTNMVSSGRATGSMDDASAGSTTKARRSDDCY